MFPEELWKVKEETLLQDELATAIRESVTQVLSEVRSPIRVTIDYEPKGDIAVKSEKLTFIHNFSAIILIKYFFSFVIPPFHHA